MRDRLTPETEMAQRTQIKGRLALKSGRSVVLPDVDVEEFGGRGPTADEIKERSREGAENLLKKMSKVDILQYGNSNKSHKRSSKTKHKD